MSRREEYEERTEALLAPIAQANGVSVYDVEYVKEGADYYLRAYIDKPEGVSILDGRCPTNWTGRTLFPTPMCWR